jgi:hypothetical protein
MGTRRAGRSANCVRRTRDAGPCRHRANNQSTARTGNGARRPELTDRDYNRGGQLLVTHFQVHAREGLPVSFGPDLLAPISGCLPSRREQSARAGKSITSAGCYQANERSGLAERPSKPLKPTMKRTCNLSSVCLQLLPRRRPARRSFRAAFLVIGIGDSATGRASRPALADRVSRRQCWPNINTRAQ